MLPRRLSLLMSSVCALVLLTSCSSSSSSVFGQSSAQGGGTSTAGQASPPANTPSLGNYRTVDPCSFLNKDTFNQLAPVVKIQGPTVSYGSCSLSLIATEKPPPPTTIAGQVISQPGKLDSEWLVSVDTSKTLNGPSDYQSQYQAPVTEQHVSGWPVYEGTSAQFGCVRGIPVPGNHTILITAQLTNGKPTTPCQAADEALTTALSVLDSGQVQHVNLPSNSPGLVDPCPTFTHAAGQVLGANVTATPSSVFSCSWTTPQRNIVTLTVTVDSWPPQAVSELSNPQQTQISGHAVLCASQANAALTFATCYLDYGASALVNGGEDVIQVQIGLLGNVDLSGQEQQFLTSVVNTLATQH